MLIYGAIMTDNEREKGIARLKRLINLIRGSTWNDRVCRFAVENGRSRSSVYRWLTSGPPLLILDGIEYRLTRKMQPD